MLQNLIDKKGWTQSEYARRAGRSQRMISHFCNNRRVMQPEDIYTALLLFGCDFTDLFEFIVEKDGTD